MKYPMRMLSALLSVSLFCAYLMVGSAFAQNYNFPDNPTLNQIVTGPGGQQFQWDGTKWVAVLGSGAWLPVNNPTYTGILSGTGSTSALVLPNTASSSLYWGSLTAPTASLTSVGSGNINVVGGAYYNGTNWIATAPQAELMSWGLDGIDFYVNPGLTVGSSFSPTVLSTVSPTGINLKVGTYMLNGTPLLENGTYVPALAFGGASTGITYSVQGGSYEKIDNLVSASVAIVLSSKGSATGAATITLPFIARGGISPGCQLGYYFTPGFSNLPNFDVGGAGNLVSIGTGQPGIFTSATDANFTDTTNIQFNCTYTCCQLVKKPGVKAIPAPSGIPTHAAPSK